MVIGEKSHHVCSFFCSFSRVSILNLKTLFVCKFLNFAFGEACCGMIYGFSCGFTFFTLCLNHGSDEFMMLHKQTTGLLKINKTLRSVERFILSVVSTTAISGLVL